MKSEYLTTFTGRRLDPLNAKLSDISLTDIAHALSLLCRYGGHTKTLLSVAEHSIYVAFLVYLDTYDIKIAYAALMHDATEAYMQDLVSPVKHRIPSYKREELKLEKVIHKHFGISLKPYERKAIHKADLRARESERLSDNYLTAKQAESNFLRLEAFLRDALQHPTYYTFTDVIDRFETFLR